MPNSRPDSRINRRQFVTTLAGGVALLGRRGGFQVGAPISYNFYRVLTAGDPSFQPRIQTMTAAVMMGPSSANPGVETIYLHGMRPPAVAGSDPIPTAFQLLIDYSVTPPRVAADKGGIIARRRGRARHFELPCDDSWVVGSEVILSRKIVNQTKDSLMFGRNAKFSN